MTDKSFIIHLVSNVAPDIFPKNNPSKFSTPLAEEIDVSGDDWEVGVRQIMYPAHVATTGEEDKILVYDYKRDSYKSQLPVPPVKDKNTSPATTFTSSVPNKDQSIPSSDILRSFNTSPWATKAKNFYFLYRKDKKKFILNNYKDDILIMMNKSMREYLGYQKEDICYNKGTFWAESNFDEKAKPLGDFTLTMYDLKIMESESHELLWSVDSKTKQGFYSENISYEYKDTLPDEWFPEAQFSIIINMENKTVKIKPVTTPPKKFQKHVKTVTFIRFQQLSAGSKETKSNVNTEKIRTSPVYYVDTLKADGTTFKLPFLKNKTEKPEMENINVRLYYNQFRELEMDELISKPIHSFSVSNTKEIKDPAELLSELNTKSETYGYEFSYNRRTKRFELIVRSSHGIQMSQSLSDILGFGESDYKSIFRDAKIAATSFPVLHRAITALYVYTNIIDSVYIGNVKAPLLLTCPFKKTNSKQNVTEQQEFLNPCYTALNRSKLQQVDIGIYDDAGTLIPFLNGKTKLSLHFRRRTTP